MVKILKDVKLVAINVIDASAALDRAAQYFLGISGECFTDLWERGMLNAENPDVTHVAMLAGLTRLA